MTDDKVKEEVVPKPQAEEPVVSVENSEAPVKETEAEIKKPADEKAETENKETADEKVESAENKEDSDKKNDLEKKDAPEEVVEEKKKDDKKEEEPVKEAPVENDPEAIREALVKASGHVDMLKSELANADKKKEEAFKKKQDIGSQIADKIRKVNEFKGERNELTRKVRELKKKRDELNNQINERVKEIKKLMDGKPIQFPKRGRSRDPDSPEALKRQMEQLEYKLETQPMGFTAEQKINKEIKGLRKIYDEKMQKFKGMEDVLAKSKEIDKLKREANELHAQVTKMASDSQKRHETLLEQSKEIEDLKKQEEEVYKAFVEYKNIYSEINAKLRTKMGVVHEKKDIVRKERQVAHKKKQDADQKTLKERAKEAETKFKKKQKLTTEDLLAMQGMK